MKFATQLSEMSEELSTLSREVEKVRKSSKELGSRLERNLNEQDGLVEKVCIFFPENGVFARTEQQADGSTLDCRQGHDSIRLRKNSNVSS